MGTLHLILTLFAFGAALGSFLNVIIDRLSTGRSIVYGRSYCESCKKTLKWYDLIPVLSYATLLGRCRYCRARIPFRIFIVEVLVGLSAVALFWVSMGSWGSMGLLGYVSLFFVIYCFIGIFFADIEYGIIPDLLVVVSVIGSVIYIVSQGYPLHTHLLAALGSFAFFLLLYVVTKGRGMGLGDVKFAFVLGLLLGFPLNVVALYLAFLTGASISIILVVWKKIRFSGGTIPFGPFLVASTIIALFYGENLLEMFISRFF